MLGKIVATLAAGSALALTSVVGGGLGVASASTSPVITGYGFDGNAHLIVGGGSTTVFKLAQSLAVLWEDTSSCATQNTAYNGAPAAYPPSPAVFNQCTPAAQSYTGVNAGGNYDGDTVAIAEPSGSSTGIASLNGANGSSSATQAYEGTNGTISDSDGTDNGYGTLDFALSSRGPKLTGGNCAAAGANGDEEKCDTFWGIAADGVEVFTWLGTNGAFAGTGGLTATDLYNIFNCTYTQWGQLPEYTQAAAQDPNFPASTDPIVPWSMNSTSGTYSDFDNYIRANATGAPANWVADNACERKLSTGALPLENDTKPLLEDVQLHGGGLTTTDDTSTNDPANWIWFGSYGLFSNYSYLSSPTLYGTTWTTGAVPIGGTLPSSSNIHSGSYPIGRVLSLVTANADATCPANAGGTACDFTDHPGPTNGNSVADLNVQGGTTGSSGAIREFIRFACRDKAESSIGTSPATYGPDDAYTGVAGYSEIASATAAVGFTTLPTSEITPGSNCDVIGHG